MTQAEALAILKMGHSVFLTGSAGSGKTYVLNAYIKHLNDHGVTVAVTASTGIAATHMQGVTIHAWSGIGIKESMSDYEIDQLEQKRHVYDRFQKTKVLIIDEVSMLSGTFLDLLDRVCRSMKRSDEPFGGMQVVLCGDLFQLPPVSRNEQPDFVIESQAWDTMGLVICYLTEQHRQDDDQFISVLNAIRDGRVEEEHRALLRARICSDANQFDCITTLFTHNVDVDVINNQKLADLDGEVHTYVMHTKGRDVLVQALQKGCLALETLVLKRGAEVMFIKNNSEAGYVNGTRGVVVDFTMSREPIVETVSGKRITVGPEEWSIEDDGKVKALISQLPLRHAWAITIHKSQGMSLDAAVMDLSKSFVSGMGYVALSRVRSLAGVHLLGINNNALFIDPRVRAIDSDLRSASLAAAQSLGQLSSSDIKKVTHAFIESSGGYLDPKTASQKKKHKTQKLPTHMVSYALVKDGKTLQEAAAERGLTSTTIVSHLEQCKNLDMFVAFPHIALPPQDLKRILAAFKKARDTKLSPVKKALDTAGHRYSFEVIRIARLFIA